MYVYIYIWLLKCTKFKGIKHIYTYIFTLTNTVNVCCKNITKENLLMNVTQINKHPNITTFRSFPTKYVHV